MNGLTSALSNALAGLLVTSGQSAVVSRNITRANDENYSRETAVPVTNIDGSVRLAQIQRSSEKQLTDTLLKATSDSAAQSTILNAFKTLSNTVGDVQSDGSVAWGIDQLQQALQGAESDPSNKAYATQAVARAGTLASILNSASTTVQQVRNDADAAMADSVKTINGLLSQFQTVDNTLSSGSATQEERAASLDQRDAILKQLSAEIGIRTTVRPDGGMAIYTDSGVTLFDKVPRSVTFSATPSLAPGASGNAVYADGVPIVGAPSPMPSKTGRLSALANLRDQVAPTYQNQLDEMARGLITTFSEQDQSATPTQPDATGLFTYAGSPAVPAAATLVPGLASTIKLNAAFDVNQGGNPFLLRDGGANGAAYVYNASNLSGYQGRLTSLISAMGQPLAFSSATKLVTSNTIAGLATASAGWVEAGRSDADSASTAADATQTRAKDALSRTTGVNLDEEMSMLLSLEKSYQASAKLLTTVDQMLGDLMNAVR